MVANQKVTGTATTIPAGILMGLGISILITLAGAAVAAWLISSEAVPQERIGLLSAAVLFVSAGIGSLVAAGKVKRMRVQMCLLSGVSYYLSLLAMTALFFGGRYEGMGVTAIVVAVGCASGALAGLKGKSRGSGGGRNRRSR